MTNVAKLVYICNIKICSYRLYNTNSVSHQSVGGQQDEIIDIELIVPDVDQSQLRKTPKYLSIVCRLKAPSIRLVAPVSNSRM